MIFLVFFNGFVKIQVFDLQIVFQAFEAFWGVLLGLSELHFGSQEAPQELSGSSFGTPTGSLGDHNLSTGPVNRDFRALWKLLDALFVTSSCSSSLSACFLLLRAPFLLASEPLGSKSELPTGLRGLKNQWLKIRTPQAWASWLRRSQVGKGRRVPRRAYNFYYF